MIMKLYQKVEQGSALVVNGMGGTKVSFSGHDRLSGNSPSRTHGYLRQANRDLSPRNGGFDL